MSAEPDTLHALLRPLGLEDVDRVMEIELAAYPFPWTRGIFEDCIRVGYDCWGLLLGLRLVGYSIQTQAAGESHLLNLCVAPECQRHGLGGLLLEHALRLARGCECASMFLEVRPGNAAAIGLYRSYGFTVIGERKDYYTTHGGRENALVMRLGL
jgi:ribosomal-protein-alanine N-acetyltransferase